MKNIELYVNRTQSLQHLASLDYQESVARSKIDEFSIERFSSSKTPLI